MLNQFGISYARQYSGMNLASTWSGSLQRVQREQREGRRADLTQRHHAYREDGDEVNEAEEETEEEVKTTWRKKQQERVSRGPELSNDELEEIMEQLRARTSPRTATKNGVMYYR